MLQQAALSLLAGKGKAAGGGGLFNAIGLDEVSMGQASTTNLDGTSGTEATVKSHINRLFAKAGVTHRAQAVQYAYEHGLVTG